MHRPAFTALLFAISATLAAAAPSNRPNVILMMADDMGMGDTSAFQDFTGNADEVQVDTPAMERLARMGVRFTDAHTPSSRCSPTRYGLLTGRYPWRNRLKYWVLFGSQGDPMIEPGRPTLATLFKDHGYGTGMVGKWHVGLRYSQSDGKPAAGWADADLTKPLHTTPLDHGFDYCRFTSRSHGTSGPDAGVKAGAKAGGKKKKGNRNNPTQSVGPGHIHGRTAVGATKEGKQLVADGPDAYVLTNLGSRHSDHAIEWLDEQVAAKKPFFLYYPSNSNHGPYTPDDAIGGKPVKGAARTKSGEPMDARHDYIYENDVALGRLLDYLDKTDDPRNPGQKLVANTLVIFTSDNGAEKNSDIASGPFRSHKGSCYEGGHRVPFIVAWKDGKIGNGDESTPGKTSGALIGLCDMFATFAEILDSPLPDLRAGEKGAEDSFNVLAAMRGQALENRPPLFFSDHKEMKEDNAVLAMRFDSPYLDGERTDEKIKIFFNANLVRTGRAIPFEVYDLANDQWEKKNLIDDPKFAKRLKGFCKWAEEERNAGGHRYVEGASVQHLVSGKRVTFDWRKHDEKASDLAHRFAGKSATELSVEGKLLSERFGTEEITMTIKGVRAGEPLKDATFAPNERGLGLSSGEFNQVDDGEALLISFDRDVLVESAAIVAGNGLCGGFYQVGDHAPLAIYCVDADNDAKDQHGILSDIGVLKKGQTLRLDSSPHYGVEPPGQWRLGALTVQTLTSLQTF